MLKKVLCFVGALGVVGCGEIDLQEDVALESVEQEVIVGSEDWTPIDLQDLDLTGGTYRAIEASARAVFNYVDVYPNPKDSKRCTAFMVSDHFAVTAWHCVEGTWNPPSTYKNNGTFDAGGTLGLDFYNKRIFQLGLTLNPGQSATDFRNVKCKHWEEFDKYDRDQVVLKCQETTTANAIVPVGAFWGHVETQILPFSQGEAIAGVSVNERTFEDNLKTLWSGSTIGDTSIVTPCEGLDALFEHSADMLPGSSGAPIFSKASKAVRGVNKGTCIDWTVNVGTLFPPALSTYRDISPTIQTLTKSTSGRDTAWVGNTSGGVAGELNCPANYAVVGVIGDTYEHPTYVDGNIGTFGIICAPYWVQSGATPRIQTTNYTVHTKGSYNNNFVAYSGDYNKFKLDNPFINELHCAPGQYVAGANVYVDASNKINRLSAIRCKSPGANGVLTRYNTHASNAIGRLSGGSYQSTYCSSGKASTGMKVRAGWYTDAFSFMCDTF